MSGARVSQYEIRAPGLEPICVTKFDGCDEQLERYGVGLIQLAANRLSKFRASTNGTVPPEGPQFRYDDGVELFCGRSGSGPLRIMLDTNIAIDVVEQGELLWEGIPDASDERGEELEALQLLLAVWAMRDVRLYLPPVYYWDSKKPLAPERRRQRRAVLQEVAAALNLAGEPSEHPGVNELERETKLLKAVLADVPAGVDRTVVRQALVSDMHVVLTIDRGMRRAAPTLRCVGLQILSPQELLGPLAESGGLHCLIDPRTAYWPLPDQHRVSHLARLSLRR